MKPELKVASVQPPPLVYEGRYTYLAEGFAFDEFNGLYKPHSYHEGKLRYRHETYSYELFYSSTWVLARCKKNCFTQYKSGPVYVDHFPHDIETWFDSNGRVSQGKFTIHKQHR